MAQLSKRQVKNMVYSFYQYRGKYPPGVTYQNFELTKMVELQVDDPPLPGDAHFEKKKLSTELQHLFFQIGYQLDSPLAEMKKSSNTIGEFHKWCYEHHHDIL